MTWQKAQKWEEDWHGSCVNTYGEEEKQLLYANRMGLSAFHDGKSPYNFDLGRKSILDIGGGPSSLLLKCINYGEPVTVLDPLTFPDWVYARYDIAGISYIQMMGEQVNPKRTYDESWIYNVLQHTQSPASVIKSAQKASRVIRIFEWIETEVNIGHPHSLTEDKLNEWLSGEGKVETLNGQANCCGRCYYGIFPT